MPYAQDTGYTASDINTIMLSIMDGVNAQFGTSYTADTFPGTNFYKYFYALAQQYQSNEIKTSEIFAKLQGYFDVINAQISRPVGTNPGLIEKLESEGYITSVKAMILADAGKTSICVNVNDGVHAHGNITITSYSNLLTTTADTVGVGATTFTAQSGAATPGAATFQAATSNNATATSLAAQINAHATAGALVRAFAVGAIVVITAIQGGTGGNSIALAYTDNGGGNIGATKSGTALTGGTTNAAYAATKLAINTIIKDSVSLGIVTQGTESSTIVLTNGQAFDFKYYLPNKKPVGLRLTLTLSENNQSVVGDPEDVKQLLIDNIAARYRLGKNFEPQRYFAQSDAPWTSQVLLEYTFDVVDGAVIGSPTYVSTIYDAAFDELLDIDLTRVSLVEV